MPVFFNETPIKKITIFTPEYSIKFQSQNYSIIYVVRGTVLLDDLRLAQEELLLLPPRIEKTISNGFNSIVALIELDNYSLLSSVEDISLFYDSYNSANHIFLKTLNPYVIELIRLHNTSEELFSFLKFTAQINRLFPSKSFTDSDNELPAKAIEILKYIHRNILKSITLNDTAFAVNLTPQYLSNYFQNTFLTTFKDYVNEIKSEYCIALLKYTDISEFYIAGLTGFASVNSMDKVLVQKTGMNASKLHEISFSKYSDDDYSYKIPERFFIKNYLHLFSEGSIKTITSENDHNEDQQNFNTIFTPNEYTVFEKKWSYILNIGSYSNFNSSNFRQQIIETCKLGSHKYIRFFNIFESVESYQVGQTRYLSLENTFKALDFILSLGTKPYICFGDSNSNDKDKFQNAIDILPDFIKACCNRYGIKQMADWHFEIIYGISNKNNQRQTAWQYINSYVKIEKIIHSYAPESKVGGPAFNTIESFDIFNRILQTTCDNHINFDFISFSIFSNKSYPDFNGIYKDGSICFEKTTRSVELISKYHPNASKYICEYGIVYNNRNYLNDSLFCACFSTWFSLNSNDLIDCAGHVLLSDIATKYTNTRGLLYGGNGQLNHLGIPKPAYYAFKFLSRLGTVRLNSDVESIITAKNKYSIQALLFHCPSLTEEAANSMHNNRLLSDSNYGFEPLPDRTAFLKLKDLYPGKYLIKEYRINNNSGNILSEYSKISDVTDLSVEDIECINEIAKPSASLSHITVTENQSFQFPVHLSPLELVLILIDYNKGL